MAENKDWTPAFPVAASHTPDGLLIGGHDAGMALRDWFAGLAMSSMLTGCVGMIGNDPGISAYAKGHCNHAVVERAYVIADAMMKERLK